MSQVPPLFKTLDLRAGVPALNHFGSREQVTEALNRLYEGLSLPVLKLKLEPNEDVVTFLNRTAREITTENKENPFSFGEKGSVHHSSQLDLLPEYMSATSPDMGIRVQTSPLRGLRYFSLIREEKIGQAEVINTLCSTGDLRKQVLLQQIFPGGKQKSQVVMTSCDGPQFIVHEKGEDNPFRVMEELLFKIQ